MKVMLDSGAYMPERAHHTDAGINMMKEFDENDLVGNTIKEICVDGYHVTLLTTDGLMLNYDASDGGYSCWEVVKNG